MREDESWIVPIGKKNCSKHKELRKRLAELQRLSKRYRDKLNLKPSENSPTLKLLGAEIRDRLLFMFNIRAGELSGGCGYCKRFGLADYYKGLIGESFEDWYNRVSVSNCLPSSTVEQSIRNRQVVSSNLAGGSNVLS